jgi:hypothetical protein
LPGLGGSSGRGGSPGAAGQISVLPLVG